MGMSLKYERNRNTFTLHLNWFAQESVFWEKKDQTKEKDVKQLIILRDKPP